MSDDLAALTRQLGVCELQEQRLLRAVQLATSSRDQETEQLDQCKQNLVEAEQSTAEDMLDICRTLSARSETIYDTMLALRLIPLPGTELRWRMGRPPIRLASQN